MQQVRDPSAGGARMGGSSIEIDKLKIAYERRRGDSVLALDGVSLRVNDGQFCTIVGASGCGKSTLLKVLAGLVRVTDGGARIGGEPILAPREDIGFVFQSPTLLPWMNVLDNVMVPLRVQGRPNKEGWRARATELLTTVGLGEFAQAYPFELSGGMQQRVGIARALIHDPRILLMDEPFGALDALTRETMSVELQRIWMLHRKTVLFVTHSISEAIFLGDRVVVMSPRPGRVVADLEVDLPRPRQFDMIGTSGFSRLSNQIRGLLNHGETR